MEEMQGIMSLPQTGGAAPQPRANPQEEALFEQLREQVPPKQFSDELLSGAMQADPQAVKEFVDELRAQSIPMDMLMLLNKMVDEILSTPQDYQRIRRQYMQQGIPEDVLPAQFDPMFFVALNMALDYLTVEQPAPMGMAGGGIADLAQYGRFGDTMLAHITPEEAALLKARGGSGTINPVTGLPEFFLGKLFKSIGNAVKKFAQSSIGRIVLPIALGFFAGIPLAGDMGVTSTAGIAAVSGFVGSAGTAILQGKNIGEAIKAGAIGGVTAGATAGIMGGADAFASTQAPAPISAAGAETLVSPGDTASAALPSLDSAAQTPAANTVVGSPADTVVGSLGPNDLVTTPMNTGAGSYTPGQGFTPAGGTEASALNRPYEPLLTNTPLSATPAGGRMSLPYEPLSIGNQGAPIVPEPQVLLDGKPIPYSQYQTLNLGAAQQPAPGFFESAKNLDLEGMYKSLSPAARAEAGLTEAISKAKSVMGIPANADIPEKLWPTVLEVAKRYEPGILSTYGPMAAAALVGTAALGGFKETPAAAPNMPAFDFANPAYAKPLTFGGLYGSRGYAPRTLPIRSAKGGIMALEMGGTTYPRKQGHINGPGTGTSDSIPALLSDGEFVFTAKAVRNLGNGSRKKGAKRLYSMMKMLEERKV